MKILLICSKAFYDKLPYFREELKKLNHRVYMPNCFDAPETESKFRGTNEHANWKASMFRRSKETIENMDAVLVLNYDKNNQKNYIGGATFLEMYDAFCLNKKIYMLHDIPDGMLKDEIIGFNPIVIHEDLSLIKE